MRHMMIVAALAMLLVTPVAAQTKPTSPAVSSPPGVCATLASSYEAASMDLAANQASGIGDNSAPRATLRAMEDANTLATARITLDLMRDNRCALPKSAPAAIFYLSNALSCATDRLKGVATPPSCDRSSWQRLK